MIFMSRMVRRWYRSPDTPCRYRTEQWAKVRTGTLKGSQDQRYSQDTGTDDFDHVCLVDSHNHVRERAGLFDVGHMVQSK